MSVKHTLRRLLNAEILQFAYNRQWVRATGSPVVFQIELTNHCPMTCEMCPRTNQMTRPLGFMQEDVYRRIIDEAAETTSRVFLHHFGDSLVHPRIGEFIGYARMHGIRTCLSANPILLTELRVRTLVDNGLDELVLSLDGVTEETSAAVRGHAAQNVRLAEERIQSLIEYRRQAGRRRPFVVLQIVPQKQNLHEVEDWLKKWRRRSDVDRVKVKSYVTWNGDSEKINHLRPDHQKERVDVVCDKPWTSVTILWDGRVVPCCFDYDAFMTLGKIGERSLKEIWQGTSIERLRRCHRNGDLKDVALCAKCKDKEGYPVRKWFYPLNRLLQRQSPLGSEWQPKMD